MNARPFSLAIRVAGFRAVALCAAMTLVPLAAHAISTDTPNPPQKGGGSFLYPPDSQNNPDKPVTQRGRADTLGLASPSSGIGPIDDGTGLLLDSPHGLTAVHLFGCSIFTTHTSTLKLSGGSGLQAGGSNVAAAPGYVGPVGTNDGQRRVSKVSADGSLEPVGQSIASYYQGGNHTYIFEFYSSADDPNPAFILVDRHYVVAAHNNCVVQFQNPDGSIGPRYGLFGSGGGGAIVSDYQDFICSADPGAEFTATPEPSPFVALGADTLALDILSLKRRQKVLQL